MENKEKVDTLIISDIHLGSRLCRAETLIETINGYAFKRLILNGDILNGFNLKRLHSHHWSVLSFLRKISKHCEIIWIEGNHDNGAENLSVLIGARVLKQYLWKDNGKKYLAIHGHQFDRVGHKNIILGGIGLLFYFVIHTLFGNRRTYSVLAKQVDGKWLRMSEQVARGALYYAKLKGADAVFCGHTHIAMESHLGKVKYYNTGSWTEVPSGYIVIKGDEVEIRKVA